MPKLSGVSKKTLTEDNELFLFDDEVEPILSVLCGKTLEIARMEVLQEEELAEMKRQQESFAKMRSNDDEEIQKVLPQVIVRNHRLLPRRVAALHQARSDSVYVLPRESGWNNCRLQCETLKLMRCLLSPMATSHWFVMSLDAHGAHIAPCVFEAACRAGVSLMVISASMTHILQPLDTHVFSNLKLEMW